MLFCSVKADVHSSGDIGKKLPQTIQNVNVRAVAHDAQVENEFRSGLQHFRSVSPLFPQHYFP